jgi:putative hydrolase of the HAD superfamily
MTKALMFDLDNTLYSETSEMEARVVEYINIFVGELLGLPPLEAQIVRREGAKRYGTTLEWLVFEKDFKDVDAYLRAIHPEGEEDCLHPDPDLGILLDSIPLPKIILTNSPMYHAERVLKKLGIEHCFQAIYDIKFNGLVGKPHPKSYLSALHASDFSLETTLFVDDLPKSIRGYLALGGRAILKDEDDRFGNLGFERIKSLQELPGRL